MATKKAAKKVSKKKASKKKDTSGVDISGLSTAKLELLVDEAQQRSRQLALDVHNERMLALEASGELKKLKATGAALKKEFGVLARKKVPFDFVIPLKFEVVCRRKAFDDSWDSRAESIFKIRVVGKIDKEGMTKAQSRFLGPVIETQIENACAGIQKLIPEELLVPYKEWFDRYTAFISLVEDKHRIAGEDVL